MSLPEFSVRQVVLVNLIFILIMVAGTLIAKRIPVDVFPDISFNASEIHTPWSGASPDEVERLVTTKLEDEIDGIEGIKEMLSFSSHGLSTIIVEWDETLSPLEYEAGLNDLRAAIDRVDDLPDDAENPILTELSVSERYPVVIVSLIDAGGVGEFTLREVARDLRDRLERLPGLRKAQMRGGREREMRVLVDKNRALQYDLTLADINRVIAQNNQNFAGGTFTDPYNQEITVRALGHFESSRALSDTVVKKNPDGSHVLLGDVAEVVSGFEKRRFFSRYNGQPSIDIAISKESDTDVIDLVTAVRGLVNDYKPFMPDGMEAAFSWDGSEYVASRIEIMRNNLLLGVAFVVFVLWLTVGFRNAMLAIVGVPFSFLAAMLLFPYFGITINALSLVGFIMVSGMLVDDAIIILENIYRRVETGEPLAEAVINGTEEVMWPVAAAIFTTMAAFIPLLTISGTSGEFMSILPKTVIVCLLGSLLEALVILPAHYLDWGSRQRAADALADLDDDAFAIVRWSHQMRSRIDDRIDSFRNAYQAAQRKVLVHRRAFLFLCAGSLVFAFGLSKHIPVDLFPSDFNNLIVSVEAPTDFGVEQMDDVMRGIEATLSPLIPDELTDVSTNVGMGMDADQMPIVAVNRGLMFISFPSTRQNIANPSRIPTLVRDRIDAYMARNPQGIAAYRVSPPRNGPPIGKPVAIRIQSEDYAIAKRIADEMKAELAAIPGVFDIEDNVPLGARELRVKLDEYRASLHGLTFESVGFALMAANEGSVPSTFKEPNSDEDIDIRVLLQADQRRSIGDLLDVEIRTPAGYLVKLGDVATIDLERGFQRLYHYDAERAVVVYAEVDDEQATSTSVNEQMYALFKDIPERYPGVNLVFGGEFQATAEAFSDIRSAFLLAVLAIYAILAAQFRSYLQPFIVMSVIVFSFLGVVLGLYVLSNLFMGYAFSMYVIYAIVGLAGIVVNDSLVLIDFVNQERRRGTPPLEAVSVASRKRFRPILLTTITTVTGLLPMAIGISGYSVVFGPFATAIVFGLSVASLLTLFVVPSLYLALEDSKQGFAALLRGGTKRASAATAAEARFPLGGGGGG